MTSYISVCFSGRVNSKQIEEKMTLRGPGTRAGLRGRRL